MDHRAFGKVAKYQRGIELLKFYMDFGAYEGANMIITLPVDTLMQR